jgi:hypothetical protein
MQTAPLWSSFGFAQQIKADGAHVGSRIGRARRSVQSQARVQVRTKDCHHRFCVLIESKLDLKLSVASSD